MSKIVLLDDFLINSTGISLFDDSEIRSRLREARSLGCPNCIASIEEEVL
jgi:hypothetical protein